MHDEKAKKTDEIIFSVTQSLTCELPQFLRDFGDYACKLKNYVILSQFVILLNVPQIKNRTTFSHNSWLIDTRDFENSQIALA